MQDWRAEGSVAEEKCLSGQEKTSNGVEERNKPRACVKSLSSPFLDNTGETGTVTHVMFLPLRKSE